MKSFEEVVGFHGHACPGLALGYRVAELALGELGGRAGDEELVAIVENDSCAVDAVQVLTGCTFGKGNLRFLDYGKQVYTFVSRGSGRSIRIAVSWRAPEETATERDAWSRYSSGDRAAGVLAVVHERKSRKIDSIMSADFDDLFTVSREPVELPPKARLFASVACEACGEKTMEPRVRMKNGRIVCIPCFGKD